LISGQKSTLSSITAKRQLPRPEDEVAVGRGEGGSPHVEGARTDILLTACGADPAEDQASTWTCNDFGKTSRDARPLQRTADAGWLSIDESSRCRMTTSHSSSLSRGQSLRPGRDMRTSVTRRPTSISTAERYFGRLMNCLAPVGGLNRPGVASASEPPGSLAIPARLVATVGLRDHTGGSRMLTVSTAGVDRSKPFGLPYRSLRY